MIIFHAHRIPIKTHFVYFYMFQACLFTQSEHFCLLLRYFRTNYQTLPNLSLWTMSTKIYINPYIYSKLFGNVKLCIQIVFLLLSKLIVWNCEMLFAPKCKCMDACRISKFIITMIMIVACAVLLECMHGEHWNLMHVNGLPYINIHYIFSKKAFHDAMSNSVITSISYAIPHTFSLYCFSKTFSMLHAI